MKGDFASFISSELKPHLGFSNTIAAMYNINTCLLLSNKHNSKLNDAFSAPFSDQDMNSPIFKKLQDKDKYTSTE